MCIGDEVLEPPSCGQRPGHRMEGLRAACLMEEAPERQTREPEGSGERNGSGSECVCWGGGYRLFTVPLSALVGTPIASGNLRQKAAGQRIVLTLFWLLFFGEI